MTKLVKVSKYRWNCCRRRRRLLEAVGHFKSSRRGWGTQCTQELENKSDACLLYGVYAPKSFTWRRSLDTSEKSEILKETLGLTSLAVIQTFKIQYKTLSERCSKSTLYALGKYSIRIAYCYSTRELHKSRYGACCSLNVLAIVLKTMTNS